MRDLLALQGGVTEVGGEKIAREVLKQAPTLHDGVLVGVGEMCAQEQLDEVSWPLDGWDPSRMPEQLVIDCWIVESVRLVCGSCSWC